MKEMLRNLEAKLTARVAAGFRRFSRRSGVGPGNPALSTGQSLAATTLDRA